MVKVKDKLEVAMNFFNPIDHVTDIEINNITAKERYHSQYHRLPFQNIPKVMIIYFSFEVVINFNFFPVKGYLYPYYIP